MEERRNQRDPAQQNQNQQPQQSQGGQRQPQQAQPGSEQRQQGQSETGRAAQGGQQSGMSGARQQQQFDPQSGQQAGGSGTDMRFADQIREHMDVIDQSGAHVGTVDHVEGDRIKLTRSSSSTGEHQYVPLSEVAGVERDSVRLRYRGDATFGMEGGRQT